MLRYDEKKGKLNFFFSFRQQKKKIKQKSKPFTLIHRQHIAYISLNTKYEDKAKEK